MNETHPDCTGRLYGLELRGISHSASPFIFRKSSDLLAIRYAHLRFERDIQRAWTTPEGWQRHAHL